MQKNWVILNFIFLIFASCHHHSPPSSDWQLIKGRNEEHEIERPFIYRALVPKGWVRQDPPEAESIANTILPICEFYIHENGQTIRLTIHTFPIKQGKMRIPPQAQIARWKKQFEELDVLATHVQPTSHGGFSGLFFEGQGLILGQPVKVIGSSMQLASLYDQALVHQRHPLDPYKRADYTIKASGPPALMDQHRHAILAFARSFELIDELPSPL